jgi:hypothetical protein
MATPAEFVRWLGQWLRELLSPPAKEPLPHEIEQELESLRRKEEKRRPVSDK